MATTPTITNVPTLATLATQVAMLQATITSLQAQLQTLEADIQTATLTMESSYNVVVQNVAALSQSLNSYFNSVPASN